MSRHIVFMNWRDTANPEGGGSEVFVEHIARGLVERGHRVTVVCAAHDQAPADEMRDGVRFVRRGNHVEASMREVGGWRSASAWGAWTPTSMCRTAYRSLLASPAGRRP